MRNRLFAQSRAIPLIACFALLPWFSPATMGQDTFTTPVALADLDPTAFRVWVDGAESTPTGGDRSGAVTWTQDGGPPTAGLLGLRPIAGARPSPSADRVPQRHVGRSGAGASRGTAERPETGAPYPGDLANEEHWISAVRLKQVDGGFGCKFPPTTALRLLVPVRRLGAASGNEHAGHPLHARRRATRSRLRRRRGGRVRPGRAIRQPCRVRPCSQ